MKKMFKKITALSLVMAMTIVLGITAMAAPKAETVENLKNDLKNVTADNFEEVNAKINAYVEERLDEYFSANGKSKLTVSQSEIDAKQVEIVTELLGYEANNVASRSNSQYHDIYFNWSKYGQRNGYSTYSMDPKPDVRTGITTIVQTAWVVLRDTWSISMGSDTYVLQSLENQFMCHGLPVVGLLEEIWDIEKERPVVSTAAMIAARCNP